MAPSKRPAETPPASAPAKKKRGRPAKNSIEESEIARENAERISEDTRAFQRENADSYIGELIRLPGDGWSQVHEDAVEKIWQESEHRQAVVKMTGTEGQSKGKTTQPQLLKLFKVCLRVFRISPIRFLSFSHGLEYLGERGSSAIFSKAYSDALTSLIVHPAFEGKKNNLAIVIQYAVICRIDDRRLWPDTTSMPACPALAKMAEVMNESNTSESEHSIHRTHLEARRECQNEGKTPSKLSDLLFEVGKTVKKSTAKGIDVPDEAKQYRGLPVRPVSLYDLKHIKKTLDETTWPSESWNCTTEEALYSYQLVINQSEVPNAEELPIYYARSHKRKLRDWMIKSNSQPQRLLEEDLEFGGIDQGNDDGGSLTLEVPSNPEHASNIERMADVATKRPELIPDRFNPDMTVAHGQGDRSPSKSELLARVNDQDKKIADQRREINDLQKRVAALETEQRKRSDNALSQYEAGREFPGFSLSNPQSVLDQRGDSPTQSYHGMDDFDDTGSYHGMDDNRLGSVSPNHSVVDKRNDPKASENSRQASAPRQPSREMSLAFNTLADFQQSISFTPIVNDGSMVETGIPRAKVQRQQLKRVPLASTPITGVGCLKARSSSIARRTDQLYKLSYTDKVKNLLN